MFISVLLPEPEAPHEGDELAPPDGKGNALEHRHVDLADVVSLVDVS